MRKVFFFIALLFSVVCYAAPPPDQPTSFLIENQMAVFRSQDYIADYSFEVQESRLCMSVIAFIASLHITKNCMDGNPINNSLTTGIHLVLIFNIYLIL